MLKADQTRIKITENKIKELTYKLSSSPTFLENMYSFTNITNYLDKYNQEPVDLIYKSQSHQVKHKLI